MHVALVQAVDSDDKALLNQVVLLRLRLYRRLCAS